MDNQIQPTGNEQAGQPVTQPVQVEYLTRQEAEQIAIKAAAEAAEGAFRRSQGLITARDNKIQEQVKQLENTIALQRQVGVEITDEQAAKMKQVVIANATAELPSTPAPTVTPTQAKAEDAATQAASYFTALAVGYEKKYGVELSDDDPEAKSVLTEASDPTDYLDSYRQALEAKKLRLQSPTQPTAPPRTPTNLGMNGGAAPQIRTISVDGARDALVRGLQKK